MSMTCRTRNNNEKTKTILITLPSLNWCDLMDTSTQLMIIIIIIRERLSAVNKINQWKKNMEKRCYKFNIIIFTRSCEWHTHKTIFLIKKMFSIRPKPNQEKSVQKKRVVIVIADDVIIQISIAKNDDDEKKLINCTRSSFIHRGKKKIKHQDLYLYRQKMKIKRCGWW